jgi:ribosomal protein S18 acetylase RimI-like enzyme
MQEGTPSGTQAFILVYEDVSLPGLRCQAAPVPWDSAIFGVAVFEIDNIVADETASDEVVIASLRRLPDQLGAALCYVRLSPTRSRESALLQRAEYLFVEYSFKLRNKHLQKPDTAKPGMMLRRAETGDEAALAAIAHEAFVSERLIRDSRISIELARRRYEMWLRTSLHSATDLVVVPDLPGPPKGFGVIRGDPPEGHVALAAIAPHLRGSGFGVRLYSSLVWELKQRGYRVGTTRVSANNPAVIRLWQSQGFLIDEGQQVFHWVRLPGR